MSVTPDRLILEGVPRVGFYEGGPGCPEDIPLPAIVSALMEYLNEQDFGCRTCRALQPDCKINCGYAFFVGVTGGASFFSWKKGWAEDNPSLHYLSDDPDAPARRAFHAAGYSMDALDREPA